LSAELIKEYTIASLTSMMASSSSESSFTGAGLGAGGALGAGLGFSTLASTELISKKFTW
jgi:hypothetical protein